jgi:hypothetical protein
MSDKKISYLSRNFDDYKQSLMEFVKKYYPQIANNFNDASVGSWLIEIVAAVADNLSFHLDRTFSETQIDSASEASSVYAIARNSGFKVPGPRPSVAEETFSCVVPVYNRDSTNDSSLYGMPNTSLMPVIKRGTKLYSGSHYFEVMDDIDFSEQFNSDGYSDRTLYANTDANGNINSYTITKKALIVGGQSKIYTQVLSDSDINPFMEIILPDKNILSIDSILVKEGTHFEANPTMSEFMTQTEYTKMNNQEMWRYFEVNSLTEQYRWGDDNKVSGTTKQGESVVYTYGFNDIEKNTVIPTCTAVKGEWIPITQKFITEYTDSGYLKVIFGCGEQAGATRDYYCNMSDISKYQVSRMIRNNFLGKLPKGGTTLYILYRIGGGSESNVAANTITSFSNLSVDFPTCYESNNTANILGKIKNSIACTNELPSVSGKDAPSVEEIKNMIKYHSSSQERCVTVKDYEERLLLMPSRYGTPFRVSVVEENNKIMIYLLGIDNNGHLSDKIPVIMVNNIENYLSKYRTINDFIEIKNGRIINISIEMELFVDKNYTVENVLLEVNKSIKEYMSVNKHQLGSDIYVGDIERVVGNVPGVLNVIDTRIFNEFGEGYSETRTTQAVIEYDEENVRTNSYEFDLIANQYMLNGETDEMFEIKYPDRDIRIKVMQR